MKKTNLWFAALALGGCASAGATLPSQELTRTAAAVRSAEDANAASSPQASLHLNYARQELSQAQQLIHDDQMDHARYLLRRAEVDAEAARSLAREATARREAEQAMKSVHELRAQTERSGS